MKEKFIFRARGYISALGHIRVLTISSYVLLACINKTDKLSRLGDLVRGI